MMICLKNRNVLEEYWETHHEERAGGQLEKEQKLRQFWGTKKQAVE